MTAPGLWCPEGCRCGQPCCDTSADMATVRVNTSDVAWIKRHGHGTGGDLAACGTDARGVMYFTTPAEVAGVEHVKFAGASMIRFDLGPDAPRDHSRWAMYPESYLVSEEG